MPLTFTKPGPHRRFIVPKDDVSYRQATQLDPQDTIILSAIVFEYGNHIEAHRRSEKEVFSYRFLPTTQGGLYSDQIGWNDFWESAADKGRRSGCVLCGDISDFYNQIYHHTIENQLLACGLPNQETKWIVGLFKSTTAGVSRGVPIGPHAAHLIAEASLIPIDNSVAASGLKFVRYADDIVIFSKSDREARQALGRLAQILDKQQRSPYVFGGASPTTGFDDSGLVVWAFGRQGVHLPHLAGALYGKGSHVPRSQLRPGDLVFFYRAGHVGIYVGLGEFVHAPGTGRTVTVAHLAGIYSRDYSGAVRIDPAR